jgi:hypothetical protein
MAGTNISIVPGQPDATQNITMQDGTGTAESFTAHANIFFHQTKTPPAKYTVALPVDCGLDTYPEATTRGGTCPAQCGVIVPAPGYCVRRPSVGEPQGFPAGCFTSDDNSFGTISDGGTTVMSPTVTSTAQAQFTAADIGHAITGPNIPANTTITAVTNTTTATMSQNATATASLQTFNIYDVPASARPGIQVPIHTSAPRVETAQDANFFSLANSDGTTWQDMVNPDCVTPFTDPRCPRVQIEPTVAQSVALRANADLFTDTSGYNQDIGIFVSDNGGADTELAWKESGGSAGIFSPNAAYVQALYSMTGGHTYVFKLKWKTNKNAPGVTIYAGAGGGTTFPTRTHTSLTAETYPATNTPILGNKADFSSLANSDGTTWQLMDPALTTGTLSPGSNSTELLGANADLFTDTTGYNQDIGIFVSVDSGTPTVVAWKESGGSAGIFSPNAAYVKEIYPMTSGHTYNFSVYWKTNKPASGVTIYAGAGSGNTFPLRSPTSLIGETLASSANPYSAVKTNFSSLANSDGSTWQVMDAAMNLTVPGSDNMYAHLGANADLFTDTTGYNQDIGLFVSDNGGSDTLIAWKESGGSAGIFSPNAAYVQSTYPLTAGHTYVFKLEWKTNKPASGVTIYAGAGGGGTFPGRSETLVVAQVTN